MSILESRYASGEMTKLWSDQIKHITWRQLWYSLAKNTKKTIGFITDEQLLEMSDNIGNFNYDVIDKYELDLKHDVMAHLRAYCDLCPKASPIIHLGATSCFITDNSELIMIKHAFNLLKSRLKLLINLLCDLSLKYIDLPCLGYTHFQPAQATTFGKRIAMWLNDVHNDFMDLSDLLADMKFRGIKGATGSQVSYSFLGSYDDILKIDKQIANDFSFNDVLKITGQTYSRKIDVKAINLLTQIAITFHKIGTDVRLLCGKKELFESFDDHQVGSSAMPYKRNPIISERICGLAKFVMGLNNGIIITAATQWLERTLDDSSCRRLSISQAFLATDAIINSAINLFSGLVVDEETISENMSSEFSFLFSEAVIMTGVMKGLDRQELHERLRKHFLNDGGSIKELLLTDSYFAKIADMELNDKLLTGFARQQAVEFINYVKGTI